MYTLTQLIVQNTHAQTHDVLVKQLVHPEDGLTVGQNASEPCIKKIYEYCWFVSCLVHSRQSFRLVGFTAQ